MAINNPLDESDFFARRTRSLLESGYPVDTVLTDFSKNDLKLVRRHCHEEIEFLYIIDGKSYITCNDDTITASKGDIIFINQYMKHLIAPAMPSNGIIKSVIANPIFIFGFGQQELESKYVNPLINSPSLKWMRLTQQDLSYGAFFPHIRSILEQHNKKTPGYEITVKISLLSIWKNLYDYASSHGCLSRPADENRHVSQDEHRVKLAVIYIHEHFMEQITLGDIADCILVSKSECCRCFKRVLGTTPFEYLMKYRIKISARRIQANPNESISEIASSVGFNNASYYNKIFKKYMYCTPTEYKTYLNSK